MAATSTLSALNWASATNQGPRKENQDRVVVPPLSRGADPRGVLLVLCDGVGGEEGGHVAAQVASQEAMRVYYGEPAADPVTHLRMCIDKAWDAVRRESVGSKFGRMASTIVLTAVHGDTLYIGHVGDSRAYLLRDGRVRQLTHDHTYVNAQIAAGVITPEEAKTSVYRSVLTRSLGANNDHTPDLSTESLRVGDRVLLCSDGLHGVVDTALIERVLAENADPEQAASALVNVALRNKTGDNVTVAVLNYGAPSRASQQSTARIAVPQPAAEPKRRSAVPLALLGVAGVLAIAAAGLFLSGALNPVTPDATTAVPTPAVLQPGITETASAPGTDNSVTRGSTAATAMPAQRATATLRPGEPTSTIVPTPTATATRRPTRTPAPTRTPVPVPTVSPTLPVTVVPVTTAQPAPPPQSEPPPQQPPPPAATEAPPQPPPPTSEPPPPGVVVVTPGG